MSSAHSTLLLLTAPVNQATMIPSEQAREEQPMALALEQDFLGSLLLQATLPPALSALPPQHPNSPDRENITLVQRRQESDLPVRRQMQEPGTGRHMSGTRTGREGDFQVGGKGELQLEKAEGSSRHSEVSRACTHVHMGFRSNHTLFATACAA